MSDEATIEDEPEVEQQLPSSLPQTKTGLLPWSYILEAGNSNDCDPLCGSSLQFDLVTKQWAIFLAVSIAIAVFLYISAQRRRSKKSARSTIGRDHVQGGSKRVPQKLPKRD